MCVVKHTDNAINYDDCSKSFHFWLRLAFSCPFYFVRFLGFFWLFNPCVEESLRMFDVVVTE